jgi:predicted MPP superfamily phosphohydrolase
MRLWPIFILSALFHAYVGARLLPALGQLPAQWALASLLVVSALSMPLGLLGHRLARQPFADAVMRVLTWLGLLCMGLFSSLMVLTLLRDAALVLLWVAGLAGVADAALSDSGVVRWSAQAVPLLAAAVTLWGFFNARRTAGVVRVDVPLTGLPPALEGFTLAQISDIHVGPTIKRHYLRRIVQRVNTLGADVVAVTGDLIDGSVAELAHHVAPLADLRSRHGTFFVTGNHEYYSGAHAWVAELRRIGLTVLMNEHVVIERPATGGVAALVLAGVTDYHAGHFDPAHRSDPAAAVAGAPAGGVRVLLAHQPRSADAALLAGFDLQLSGHTHGGQFWPWNLFVPLQQPFTAGLNRLQSLWVYTSRGTGYWGPPKRFGAPSEITLIRLVAA